MLHVGLKSLVCYRLDHPKIVRGPWSDHRAAPNRQKAVAQRGIDFYINCQENPLFCAKEIGRQATCNQCHCSNKQ